MDRFTSKVDTSQIGVIGSGLTALLAAYALVRAGRDVVVLGKSANSASQSEHCQGFVHSGLKYPTLSADSLLANNLAKGRQRWHNLLHTEFASVVRPVPVCYLFTQLDTGRITEFVDRADGFCVKVVSIEPARNTIFGRDLGFQGMVIETDELAFDTERLIAYLRSQINIIDAPRGWSISHSKDGYVARLNGGRKLLMEHLFIASGANTARLASQVDLHSVPSRRRPLVASTFMGPPLSLAAHINAVDSTPELTISAYGLQGTATVWKIGGRIAEFSFGAKEVSASSFIDCITRTFPNLRGGIDAPRFTSVDRIEPAYGRDKASVPDEGALWGEGKCFACLPTKMTLIPIYCDELVQVLAKEVDLD